MTESVKSSQSELEAPAGKQNSRSEIETSVCFLFLRCSVPGSLGMETLALGLWSLSCRGRGKQFSEEGVL